MRAPSIPPTPPAAVLAFRSGPVLFTDPEHVAVATTLAEVRPTLEAAEAAAARGCYAVGFVAYEAAPAFDRALQVRASGPTPLAWFGVFRRRIALPLESLTPPPGAQGPPSRWAPSVPRGEYDRAIASIRQAIERGDVYQVNYTLRLRAPLRESGWDLFRRLRAAQPDTYAAWLHLGAAEVVSASPELFFEWTGDRLVTRPMKGTARRGRWPAEDAARAHALAHSVKDRAENVMIVDLIRNDLGRIARTGSVAVSRLFEVEQHPTVLQLTSTIEARLRRDVRLADVFGALFPCGSVTGAPKVAAMQEIARLEEAPRGVYCGTVGLVAPGGERVFSVAIRTAWVDREAGCATYGAGGGVTWDSSAVGEYDEVEAKAAILTARAPAFDLVETMRSDGGAIRRLDLHLARLAGSAAYFAWPCPAEAIRRSLEEAAGRAAPAARLRLLLSADGTFRVEHSSLEAPSPAPLPVGLASVPVSPEDPLLFHKTTRRDHYAAERARRPDLFDTLCWNPAGEVTEFTVGNLVLELDGARWTPPREAGLLAGTFRHELLAAGAIRERPLRVEDLSRATGTWLINSVREWVAVRCEPGG